MNKEKSNHHHQINYIIIVNGFSSSFHLKVLSGCRRFLLIFCLFTYDDDDNDDDQIMDCLYLSLSMSFYWYSLVRCHYVIFLVFIQ